MGRKFAIALVTHPAVLWVAMIVCAICPMAYDLAPSTSPVGFFVRFASFIGAAGAALFILVTVQDFRNKATTRKRHSTLISQRDQARLDWLAAKAEGSTLIAMGCSKERVQPVEERTAELYEQYKRLRVRADVVRTQF